MNARPSQPTISVIIPTTGRPELARAAESARSQLGDFTIEIIVVNDSFDELLPGEVDADQILWTGGGRRGGVARNRGVHASSGEYVAFLDDDDEWVQGKLQAQLAIFADAAPDALLVVSGRHVHVSPDSLDVSAAGPQKLIGRQQRVAEYLFRRRKPSVARASMYTSTLMCTRELARRSPWREDLTRHQDWDWLIRVGNIEGVTFAHAAVVVARIQTGSSHSISASTDWIASKRWADETISDAATYVDFIFGQTLRYALSSRSTAGMRAVFLGALAKRRLPSLGPLIIGLTGLIPRQRIEQLMLQKHRQR